MLRGVQSGALTRLLSPPFLISLGQSGEYHAFSEHPSAVLSCASCLAFHLRKCSTNRGTAVDSRMRS